MVERIEQLRPELEVTILVEMNILRDRKIKVRQAWSAHDSHARTSKCLGSRTGDRECGRIEPALDGSLQSWELRVANEIRPSYSISSEIQNGASTESRRQWQSGLNYMDSRQLPIAEQ